VDDAAEANRRWQQMLAAWAIPEELIARAPEPPYFFGPAVFIAAADDAVARPQDTVSDGVAREALQPERTVLDVGVGAGAASLRLRPTHDRRRSERHPAGGVRRARRASGHRTH
jgi:hypothetical protein